MPSTIEQTHVSNRWSTLGAWLPDGYHRLLNLHGPLALWDLRFSTLTGFIVGVLATLAVVYLRREEFIFTESRYLLLEHKNLPSDLPWYVQPGTSVANMREMLVAPLAETEQTYRYKFGNL